MKLQEFVEQLENQTSRTYPTTVCVMEKGLSRKGNRKLEIQQFLYGQFSFDDEYESWFCLVVDSEENILYWEQTC